MIGALAVVIAACVAWFGTRYTVRESQKAQVRSQALEDKAVDAEAYRRARESYEAAIANFEREQRRLEARIDSLNGEVSRLEAGARDQRYDMEATIEQLVEARAEYENHLKRCRERLDRLRSRLRANGGTLSEDDPDLQVEP